MSDVGVQQELVLDRQTRREILQQIYLMFMPYTKNVSYHFDEWGIHITIFPDEHPKFPCPDGPIDIRIRDYPSDHVLAGAERAGL